MNKNILLIIPNANYQIINFTTVDNKTFEQKILLIISSENYQAINSTTVATNYITVGIKGFVCYVTLRFMCYVCGGGVIYASKLMTPEQAF